MSERDNFAPSPYAEVSVAKRPAIRAWSPPNHDAISRPASGEYVKPASTNLVSTHLIRSF